MYAQGRIRRCGIFPLYLWRLVPSLPFAKRERWGLSNDAKHATRAVNAILIQRDRI